MAAQWVVVFHGALLGMFLDVSPSLASVIHFGYAGVDVFFVISGVVMAHSTKNIGYGPRTSDAFLLERLARIYTGW